VRKRRSSRRERLVHVMLVMLVAVPLANSAATARGAGARPDAGSATIKGAFVFETAGALAAANGDGTGIRCLVSEGENAVWSPDGSAVAFNEDKPDGTSALMTLAIDDGAVQTVQDHVGVAGASWSPDGQRLVYPAVHEPGGGFDIVVANADGTDRKVLAQPTDGREPDSPAWSPRQALIAFTDLEPALPTPQDPTRSKIASIFVIDADGGGRHRIVKDIDGVFAPVWSPNGRMIAFTRSYGNVANSVMRIWVARADGQNPHAVGPLLDAFDMSKPAWSSDGRFLAVEGRPVTKRARALSRRPHVYRLQPDRFRPRLLAVARENEELNWAAWAPGARVVAFGTGNSIALVAADGGRPRAIIARGHHVAWDPLRRESTAYNSCVAPQPRPVGELPYTGLDLKFLVAVGLLLLTSGIASLVYERRLLIRRLVSATRLDGADPHFRGLSLAPRATLIWITNPFVDARGG
jgi:Tol biopolymer transport system component